jgi:hypothetical protein
MTNETLERDVADELRWDPKIDSEGIAVSVDKGIVTLRGRWAVFDKNAKPSGRPNEFTGSLTSTMHLTSAS